MTSVVGLYIKMKYFLLNNVDTHNRHKYLEKLLNVLADGF